MIELQEQKLAISISEKLTRIKERRQHLFETIEELKSSVKLSEFESYSDYFLISKFKVGKSESGRVNVVGLRNRHDRSTRKVKGNSSRNGRSSRTSSRSISSGSDTEAEFNRDAKNQSSRELENDSDYKPNNSSRIGADISTDLIIPDNKEKCSVRRSVRLTRKEKEKRSKREHNLIDRPAKEEVEVAEVNFKISVVQDLYENLVKKIVDPVRRSDWVLPPKSRYIPEKHQPVKHEPEQIKINELARNSRIKTILSRFDGGLAGVRTATT